MDAPRKDGNASMPEHVKRPNPWKKIKMIIYKKLYLNFSKFSSKASGRALGPTDHPIQRVHGSLSPGIKRSGRMADH
jgi:hypothetical protein